MLMTLPGAGITYNVIKRKTASNEFLKLKSILSCFWFISRRAKRLECLTTRTCWFLPLNNQKHFLINIFILDHGKTQRIQQHAIQTRASIKNILATLNERHFNGTDQKMLDSRKGRRLGFLFTTTMSKL